MPLFPGAQVLIESAADTVSSSLWLLDILRGQSINPPACSWHATLFGCGSKEVLPLSSSFC